MARRPGNAGVHTGTAARRAAAAPIPTVGMAPFSARTPECRMARDSGPPPGELAAGLRPASRGSAKPAPMTPDPADVSAPLPFSCRRSERADPIMWVSPGGGFTLAPPPRDGAAKLRTADPHEPRVTPARLFPTRCAVRKVPDCLTLLAFRRPRHHHRPVPTHAGTFAAIGVKRRLAPGTEPGILNRVLLKSRLKELQAVGE